MTRWFAGALAAWTAWTAPASARAKPPPPPYVDARFSFEVRIPSGWSPRPLPTLPPFPQPALVWALQNEKTRELAVVTRVVGPTDLLHVDPGVLDELEAQFRARAGTYRRLSRRRLDLGTGRRRHPALDLWFSVRDPKKRDVSVGVRFVFFPGYILALSVDSPGRRPSRDAKLLVTSFRPSLPR